MRRRVLGIGLLLVGCRNPAADLAKLDVADPALGAGWVQLRHEPGGYAFQAPKTWGLDPKDATRGILDRTGADTNLYLRLLDLDAARKGDLVSFAVMRIAEAGGDDVERLDRLKVYRLDEIGEKALKGLNRSVPNAKRERITLPIGEAEHVWGTLDKVHADGRHEAISSHMVVFVTALRPFVLAYGYPESKAATYRPTLDAMVRTVRLFLPKKNGKIDVPDWAEAQAPMPQGFGGSVNPNLAPNLGTPSAPTPPPSTQSWTPPPDSMPPGSMPSGTATPPPAQVDPGSPPSNPSTEGTPPTAENPPPTAPTTGGGNPTGDPNATPPPTGP